MRRVAPWLKLLRRCTSQLIPEDGVYGSITQQLMMSDHSPVYCGFNLAVKVSWQA